MATNYQCLVASSGYEVVTLPVKRGLLEVEGTETTIRPKAIEEGVKFVALNKHPAAFKRFTVIHDNESAVKFADRFGLLSTIDVGLDGGFSEPLYSWSVEIEALRAASTLWLATKEKNGEVIGNWIVKRKNEYFLKYRDNEVPVSHGQYDQLHPIKNEFDAAVEAYCMLARNRLSESVAATISRDIIHPSSHPQLTYAPKSLGAALWLQFALAVSNNQSFRACVECGEFFLVASKPRRFEKIYCSDRCRKRAERKRS